MFHLCMSEIFSLTPLAPLLLLHSTSSLPRSFQSPSSPHRPPSPPPRDGPSPAKSELKSEFQVLFGSDLNSAGLQVHSSSLPPAPFHPFSEVVIYERSQPIFCHKLSQIKYFPTFSINFKKFFQAFAVKFPSSLNL